MSGLCRYRITNFFLHSLMLVALEPWKMVATLLIHCQSFPSHSSLCILYYCFYPSYMWFSVCFPCRFISRFMVFFLRTVYKHVHTILFSSFYAPPCRFSRSSHSLYFFISFSMSSCFVYHPHYSISPTVILLSVFFVM